MNGIQFQQKLLSLQENMMNFALMLTANRDDAQDLLQDTTLKVLDNQDKFVDNVNFKGWVLTVMRNIFINNYHKIVRVQTVVDSSADLYNLDVVNDSGFDSPDKAYQIKEITKAINGLNDDLSRKTKCALRNCEESYLLCSSRITEKVKGLPKYVIPLPFPSIT